MDAIVTHATSSGPTMICGGSISNTDRVDPLLLRTFVTVARRGSFSAAARELGYTQSAVSQQIAALESDLGTPLLHRRPVGPTEPGRRLLEHAGPILLRLAAARADVQRAAGEPAGRVLLGAAPLALPPATAGLLVGLRQRQPGLHVALRVTGRTAVTTGVAAGDLDLGLVDGVAAPGDPLRLPEAGWLTAIAVAEQPALVALPAGHPLARRAGLALADLADAGWLEAPDVAAPLADLRAASGAETVRAAFRYTGTDTASLLALIAAGHGLAVLPASTVDGAAGVVGVPVRTPPLVHRIELVHGHLTEAAGALAALLSP
jgi:DNA-binding transcriptional LysR family regulator